MMTNLWPQWLMIANLADNFLLSRGGLERIHDDVIKWKHFPRYWSFVRNSPVSGEFPPQRPVTRSFDVFFDLRLNKRFSKLETPVIWDAMALIMTPLWCCNDVTRASWRLKQPADWQCVQQFVQTYNKENIKAQHHWSFCDGNLPGNGELKMLYRITLRNSSYTLLTHVSP